MQRADEYLSAIGRGSWANDIAQIMYQHHKVFRWRGPGEEVLESFRKADWLDACGFSLPTPVGRSLLVEISHAMDLMVV